MKSSLLSLVVFLFVTTGCASLKSVSLTQVPEDRSTPVEASATSWGVLGLYASNEFADEAIEKLRAQCPDGKITGVYTKYDGRYYVLWGTRTITAKAFCGKGAQS